MPPATGATQKSHSCPIAQSPAKTTTPVLRAGLTNSQIRECRRQHYTAAFARYQPECSDKFCCILFHALILCKTGRCCKVAISQITTLFILFIRVKVIVFRNHTGNVDKCYGLCQHMARKKIDIRIKLTEKVIAGLKTGMK